MLLIELGTAYTVDIAKDSGKDSWITLLLGIILGIILYSVYIALFRYYPNKPLTLYVQDIWGKYIGWIVGLLYVVYFIYEASRTLRYYEELLAISTFPNTTILSLGLCMIICISYITTKEINSYARASFIAITVVIISLCLIYFLEFISGLIHLSQVRPVLEHGWKPVLENLFPYTLCTPFGEMIIFTMILPFLDQKEKAYKVGILALIVSGMFLAITTLIHFSILGADVSNHTAFPGLVAIYMVNIAYIITRIAGLLITTLVILGVFKITLFFYCAMLGISHLFKNVNEKSFILPLALLIVYLSITMAWNYNEHLYEEKMVIVYYLHVPFQIVIPILLLLTAYIKNKVDSS